MQVLCRSWCALTLRLCCLMRAATAAAGVSETPVKLSDEVRLDKVKRWNSLLNSRNVLQDREDLSGVEKIKEDRAVTDGVWTPDLGGTATTAEVTDAVLARL